ncbi:formylglycine-generating enzyme family protein [Oleiagrimonas soli]|uniref:Formylglycine-generating enzyme required for sulfatase activity n=1 Tax=Oleiagrimonas soli TaxID=1543381 RepID=A0A099CUG1_9GAMM|nr:formylglycine-generating enzyme family protein [Oleiagrimonas soli]KGI77558.1 sulfatase-modifying factor protein [Oleiagrimonas soli]MBB6182961.1 formylglycine-generating enzyme required for sulfatase activity [Oleiagrimonas soli]
MPSSKSERRQRALGGAIGVGLLGLAMLYHFFPSLLHLPSEADRSQRAVRPGGFMAPPLGFDRRPQDAQTPAVRINELDAGPPLSLAPRAVIAERLRPAAASSATPQTETPALTDLLARAADALGKGNLSGDENSAMNLYMQALKLRPDSNRARTGLAHVQQRLVAEIEDDLTSGDADAAQTTLQALQQLPDAGADSRRLQRSLETLRQVRPLLAHAADLMGQGHEMQPDNDSALSVYRKVLDIDPGNNVARQGLQRIQRKLLDQALGAVAQDDFDGADAALAQAAKIDPNSTALQDTRGRIEGIRRQRAETRLQQAGTALDGGDLALAQKLRDQALAISPDVPGVNAFDQRLHNARVYANYRPGQNFSDAYVDISGNAPTMVVIPTGSFMMGSADSESGHQASESPLHKVDIEHGLAVSRTEISVAQFREFVRESGYVPDSVRLHGSNIYDGRRGTMRDDSDATWEDDYAGRPSRPDHPVVNVSWRDAEAYAAWLSKHTGKNYRLLSEAEYEYVMRAGTTTPYWWGSGSPKREVENLPGSRDRSPLRRSWTHAFKGYRDGYWGDAPVGHFAPNPFGLYDIDGNVSEWVQDCWHDNYTRAPRDGSAWVNPGCGLRMIRGASWGSSPEQSRSAFRIAAEPDTRSGRVGFRVARDL